MSCYFCEAPYRKVMGYKTKGGRYVNIKHQNVIHHIDCNRRNNAKSNLVELCELCHLRLHRKVYDRLIKDGKLKIKNG